MDTKKNWLVAGALGLIAAIVYFAALAGYTFPGESAQLIAAWKGLDPSAEIKYPLMALFAKLLGGGNLIAPICGVVAVMCVYEIVSAFVSWRVRGENYTPQRGTVATMAGVVAALVFMFSAATINASTHLEPRMFDFAWAMVSFVWVVPFLRGKNGAAWAVPILLAVFMALGLTDSALFLALLPFYLTVVVMVALVNGRKPYLPLFLFVVSFFAAFLTATAVFNLTLADHLGGVMKEFGRYYKVQGWLFIAIFTTLPFVTAIFSSRNAFGEKPGLVQWLFHGSMSFVLILSLATPLSPSALMEPYGITPVATSAYVAAVGGYLIAYWWLNRRNVVGVVAGGVLVFVILVTMVWNLFAFDGERGAFADKVARMIIDDLDDRRWLVSDGFLDNHLKIVANERGKELNLISLARDQDKAYCDELSELIKREEVGGPKNGSLQLSLMLGVLSFVQDWLASDPAVVKEVAVFGAPDLWYSSGMTPVPELLFFGADETRTPDWSAWAELNTVLKAPKGWGSYRDGKITNPVDRMRLSLRRHIGMVANNRGVYLQDQKKDDEAFKMYELVLNEIDRDNICAVFNEVAMVDQKYAPAVSKKRELERMLKAAVEDKNRRYLLWRLGTHYGYIRNADIFLRLGYVWARSGRPGVALRQIRRALEFVPTDRQAVLLNMMAALYASENDQRSSRRIYESLLSRDQRNHDALIGMMRLELMEGNNAKALEYLQRAVESSTDESKVSKERAMMAMMKKDFDGARQHLKKVTDDDPKNMQAWSLLAAVVMQQIDSTKDAAARGKLMAEIRENILPTMEKLAKDPDDYYLQSTKGFMLLHDGGKSREKAREAFIAAAKTRPDIATTHDMVLGLDISLGDRELAETHAKDVLRRNRNAPLANYVMGSVLLERGQYVEAEAFLQRAADASNPPTLALNDLAEVMRRTGKLSEAEVYARKAVERAPELYVAWETLGSILMDAGRNLDEAEASIRKACELVKEKDVRMLISLARVQIKNKDKQHAKVTLRKVQSRIGELSEFDRKQFEEVQKSAR